jgi:hypothetical protein
METDRFNHDRLGTNRTEGTLTTQPPRFVSRTQLLPDCAGCGRWQREQSARGSARASRYRIGRSESGGGLAAWWCDKGCGRCGPGRCRRQAVVQAKARSPAADNYRRLMFLTKLSLPFLIKRISRETSTWLAIRPFAPREEQTPRCQGAVVRLLLLPATITPTAAADAPPLPAPAPPCLVAAAAVGPSPSCC